jgi:glycerate 2-kinase
MLISNYDVIALTPLRKQALLIADAGLEAIGTGRLVREHFRYDSGSKILAVRGQNFETAGYKRVIVVGFGKAALQAVSGIREILGNRISCGFVIDTKAATAETIAQNESNNIVCRVGTYPYPTVVNVAATKELVAMLEQSSADDLVICVVSGGGSSLLCYPSQMTCDDERGILSSLTEACGSAQELNTVRKHISKVKGGNLAKICYPATVISLIFSDVPGNALDMVAGGPTARDSTTMHDAAAILRKYNILDRCKLPSCELVETPKEDKYFANVHNVLFASAADALEAMQKKADDLGFEVNIWNSAFQGEAAQLGRQIVQSLDRPGQCLVGAGESTVTLDADHGEGGRNQEMALAALAGIKDNQILLALTSDGSDFTDAAGAIADSRIADQAGLLGLSAEKFLARHDSFNFFNQVNGLLQTGGTGSNISDFFVALYL